MIKYIQEFSGKIIGVLQYESNGDIKATDYPSGRTLGYYRKSRDVTVDFTGKVLLRGNGIALFFRKNTKLFD